MNWSAGAETTVSEAVLADEGRWSSLHPASVVVNLLPRVWQVIQRFWPFALAFLWRGAGNDRAEAWLGFIDTALVLFFFASTVGATIMHWLTLRYRVYRGRLEIRSGLFSRQVRVLDPARIQKVELTRHLLHRLTGLVELRIETASGSEAEGHLSALSEREAESLRAQLQGLRDEVESSDEPPETSLHTPGLAERFAHAAAEVRFGAVAVLAGFGLELFGWLRPEQVASLPRLALGWQGLAVGVAVVSGAWLVGVGTTLLRTWGFSLRRTSKAWVVQGGLTTNRRLELPLNRVQVVDVLEAVPRRWLGLADLRVDTAASATGRGGTERRAAVIPAVPRDQVPDLVREAIPMLDLDPWTEPLEPPHPKALISVVIRRLVQGAGIGVLSAFFLGPWGGLAAGAGLGLAALAWLDHRHQGWRVTDQVIVARRGWLNRTLSLVDRRRVQSVTAVQRWFQRRLGIGSVVVKVAGDTVVLPPMDWEQAQSLAQWLSRLPNAAAVPVSLQPQREPAHPDVPHSLL
jgi:putative membrane protein